MKIDNIKGKFKIVRLIKLCACYSPLYFCICVLLTVIEGLMTPFMLFSVAGFIDAAVTVVSKEPQIAAMIFFLLLTVSGYLYTQVSWEISQYFYALLENSLRIKLKPDIIIKEYSVDFLTFETADVQDLILRATEDIEQKLVRVLSSVNTALSVTIQVLGILITVARYNVIVVVLYILVMVPTVIMTFKNGRVIYNEDKKINFVTRQMNYLSELLVNRESVNERTLFGYSKAINKRFMEAHLFRSNYNTKNLARETSGSMIANIVISAFSVVIIFALSGYIHTGALSVGLFTSLAGNLISLSKVLAFQSSELILEFSNHYEYAKDFDAFLNLQRDNRAGTEENDETRNLSDFEKLEIKDLWFKYKDTEEYILAGVNLTIEKGKSYSLVGLNGAGKSTLVKVITGLYRDYKGEILLNGKNLKEYSYSQLFRIFSTVSQDFAKYYISLKDNIVLGTENAKTDEILQKLDLDSLVRKLPEGEESYLGKIYENGVDISGGEWQKIAIARALYHNAPFMILDEPSASLSPTAESRMYEQFLRIAPGKTLLLISHRLGSTKIADNIVVLNKGKIVEKGSHKELVELNGIYAELFRKQSELYA